MAACITALPAAFITGSSLTNKFRASEGARTSVAVVLRRTILDLGDETIGDAEVFRDVVASMSLHVWLLPIWYRKLRWARIGLRWGIVKVAGPERSKRIVLRPRLTRFVVDRVDALEPSGVTFRRGVGLVGLCIERDRRDKAMAVDFETPDMQELLKASAADWKAAPSESTFNLSQHDFGRLADKYGQAMALVLREASTGEPIGCLSVELPPDCPVRLQDYSAPRTPSGEVALTPEGAAVIRKLRSTRNLVQANVSLSQLTR